MQDVTVRIAVRGLGFRALGLGEGSFAEGLILKILECLGGLGLMDL